jgi:hypothetical protein
MPRNGSVGYSDNTPLKNQHFTIMLQTHMRIVRSLAARYTWIEPVYHYIDLNAGPGCYRVAGEVVYGSPIIACTVADQERLPMSATFCEQDEQSLAALRHSLITFGFHTIQEHPDIFDN